MLLQQRRQTELQKIKSNSLQMAAEMENINVLKERSKHRRLQLGRNQAHSAINTKNQSPHASMDISGTAGEIGELPKLAI